MLTELLVVSGVGVLLSLGLLIHYQPKINKIKKQYEEFNQKIKDNINNMSEEERKSFFDTMSAEAENFFQDILYGNNNFMGIEQFHTSQMHFEEINNIKDQQFQEFSRWAMDIKSVTAFDHGGYVQGPGFNPSDTMAHEIHHDFANSMDNHMDMHNGF